MATEYLKKFRAAPWVFIFHFSRLKKKAYNEKDIWESQLQVTTILGRPKRNAISLNRNFWYKEKEESIWCRDVGTAWCHVTYAD